MAKVTNAELLENIRANRLAAEKYAQLIGTRNMQGLLVDAHNDLAQRLEQMGELSEGFTAAAYQTMMVSIGDVVDSLQQGMGTELIRSAEDAAQFGAEDTLDQLGDAEDSFRGLGLGGLPIDEAMVFDRAVNGAHSSVLHRLSGDPTAGPGILQRYGDNTIGEFENILKMGLLTSQPTEDVIDDLQDASPFLQGAPRSWAERIGRTESMNAYNAGAWESIRGVEDQTGEEMLKILVAIDDERTSWDSLALHGSVRRTDEPFEWFNYRGEKEYYMYPPNRPQDRETVVAWNVAWGPISEEMRPFEDGIYISRWWETYKKRSPPPRPRLTTLDDETMAILWA